MDTPDSENTISSPFRYRVIYDALARLSCNINKSTSMADLIHCLEGDLKYLFDCVVLRLCIKGPSYLKTLEFGKDVNSSGKWHEKENHFTFPFEDTAIVNNIPLSFTGNNEVRSHTGTYFEERIIAEVNTMWVWPFCFQENFTLTASVFSSAGKRFKSSDIPVLKIVCESFYAKVTSLDLLEEVILTRNKLQKAMTILNEKNRLITQLVQDQDITIQLRTKELLQRNEKLKEIAVFNSHNIREPLTRIMGLTEVARVSTDEEVVNKILPRLVISSNDLDNAIKNIILFIEKDVAIVHANV